jgi:hypothetical protein
VGTVPLLFAPGALEPSLEDYNRVLQLEPGSVDALYYRGTVYEKLGRLDEAISDFTAVLTLDPNHIKASYARGACRNLKGDFQKAIGEQLCAVCSCNCHRKPLAVVIPSSTTTARVVHQKLDVTQNIARLGSQQKAQWAMGSISYRGC